MFKQRIFRRRVLEPPEVVKIIFDQYSQNGTMSLDNLQGFLVEFQGEDKATFKHDAQAIFNSLKHLNIFSRRGLHLEAFFRYLLGELNGPLSASRGVHHDMTAPLAHYFRYTGRKSYLTEDGFSSVKPIIKALRRGVRVIDLDLWPNSTKDKVMVCYEENLNNAVELLKCLHAIKDNAFQASKYPVEITFEEHLPPNLQAKVLEMVTKTFGDMLYRPETDQLQDFPSPDKLKNKVMISTTKLPKEYLETQSSKSPQKSKASSKRETRDDEKKVRRLNLEELEFEGAIQSDRTDFVRFTQRNLVRVYPQREFFYNPFHCWIHGAQMVAASMEEYEKFLPVMQGMFRANGGCGYVKKPDFLLSSEVPSLPLQVKNTLKVTIYMGEGLDFDTPTVFEVRINGVPADEDAFFRKAIEDGWLSVWNEKFEFKLTVPELAFLTIIVRDDIHEFRAQTCLPVSELRTGIRAVPLHDRRGDKYKNKKLLVQFEKH